MNYFIYARKSTEPEDRQMSSIPDQVAEMMRVADNLGLNVTDVIAEAKSAKRPGRVGFNQMLRRIQKGEAEGILCWKLNRLARNPVDGGQIGWLLQQATIKRIQTYGKAYNPNDNVLEMQVEFAMANQYIKELKEDVERGMKRKIERGWYPTKPPVGYLAVKRELRKIGDPEIIAHPIQFSIVCNLWKLLLTKRYSVAQLKKEGDKQGLRKKNDSLYSMNAYYNLFSNEFYTGCFTWTPFNGIRTKYEGKHPAMITPSQFHDAQHILHNRGDLRQRINSFPYRGIITCGECQGNVTAEQKLQAICTKCKWKFSIITNQTCPRCGTEVKYMSRPTILNKIYYRCTKKKTPSCTQRYALHQVIEDRVHKELQSILIKKEFYEWAVAIIKALNNKPTDTKPELTQMKKRKTELQQRLTGLIRMRADGEIDKQQFERSKGNIAIDLADIEENINRCSDQKKEIDIEAKDCFDFAYHCVSLFKKGDPETKTQLLRKLGSNLTLIDKNLVIATENIYKHIKECEVAYYVKKPTLEPEKSITEQGDLCSYYNGFQLLCSKLRAIRTCLKAKVLKKIDKPIKKHDISCN